MPPRHHNPDHGTGPTHGHAGGKSITHHATSRPASYAASQPAPAAHAGPPPLVRGLSLAALTAVATFWAAGLVVAGLWLVFSLGPRWPMFSSAATMGGLTAIAMGLFVFMFLVADRLFPAAGRLVGWMIEVVVVAAFCVGLVATAWALWAGASA